MNPRPLDRPIRVIVFGGAYFEPGALRFLVMLQEHAEIELVGVFCEGHGPRLWHRAANLFRRRGLAGVAVLMVETAQSFAQLIQHPIRHLQFRRRAVSARRDMILAPDLHAPDVIARVRALVADLGLIYGGPILRPELFELPAFGTLGIHHGKVPEYRGKKTTFWAMYNGERSAGVTIQKINAGLDTGEILREGEVAIAGKRYRTVEREVEELGLDLYVEAILAVKRGEARPRPQRAGRYPLYRQPTPGNIARYLWMRAAPRRLRTREMR